MSDRDKHQDQDKDENEIEDMNRRQHSMEDSLTRMDESNKSKRGTKLRTKYTCTNEEMTRTRTRTRGNIPLEDSLTGAHCSPQASPTTPLTWCVRHTPACTTMSSDERFHLLICFAGQHN